MAIAERKRTRESSVFNAPESDVESHPYALCLHPPRRPETSLSEDAERPHRTEDGAGVLDSSMVSSTERYWAVSLLCGSPPAPAQKIPAAEDVEQAQGRRKAESDECVTFPSSVWQGDVPASARKIDATPDPCGPLETSPDGPALVNPH